MTFTLNKANLRTTWIVGHTLDYVSEVIGNYADKESIAQEEAIGKAKAALTNRRIRDLKDLQRRVSKTTLYCYKIRSLWNSSIRASVKNYEDKLQQAAAALNAPIEIAIHSLPETLTFEGVNLRVGSFVCVLNTRSLTITEAEVSINYYTLGSTNQVTYYLKAGNHTLNMRGDLTSGYSDYRFFLTWEEAYRELEPLARTEINRIEERLKSYKQ